MFGNGRREEKRMEKKGRDIISSDWMYNGREK